MTHDEMIAVIQAHKEGKEIEYRDVGHGGEWLSEVRKLEFNFGLYDYRVKRVPREYWILRHRETGGVVALYNGVAAALMQQQNQELIHVREVMEES